MQEADIAEAALVGSYLQMLWQKQMANQKGDTMRQITPSYSSQVWGKTEKPSLKGSPLFKWTQTKTTVIMWR